MITPNKFTSFDNSIISKIRYILDSSQDNDIDIMELYSNLASKFDSINEFIFTLDVLYILGNIDIDFETRTLKYVV